MPCKHNTQCTLYRRWCLLSHNVWIGGKYKICSFVIVEGNAHALINYIDTKAKCLHVKKLTCIILGWLIHPISRLES
jgi:hypothetical protein